MFGVPFCVTARSVERTMPPLPATRADGRRRVSSAVYVPLWRKSGGLDTVNLNSLHLLEEDGPLSL
jgi:hypothetical protein